MEILIIGVAIFFCFCSTPMKTMIGILHVIVAFFLVVFWMWGLDCVNTWHPLGAMIVIIPFTAFCIVVLLGLFASFCYWWSRVDEQKRKGEECEEFQPQEKERGHKRRDRNPKEPSEASFSNNFFKKSNRSENRDITKELDDVLCEENSPELLQSGISLKQGAKTCIACGAIIEKNEKFCTECGTPTSAPRLCPTCGIEVKEGKKFCGECGTKLI